jgi:hypothetical protein
MPVRWKIVLTRFLAFRRAFFAGWRPERDRALRFFQLNAIDRRQWLGIGHCRLEGSEVFRIDQIQASASR